MILYFEHYGRRGSAGQGGFCFYGNRWPQGIDPDLSNQQQVGLLWDVLCNIYNESDSNMPCHFVLRDCFGSLHATVCGRSSVTSDMDGRAGTGVELLLCLPQTAQEQQMTLDADRLFALLNAPAPPGTARQVAAGQLAAGSGGGKHVPLSEMLARAMSWNDRRIVVLSRSPDAQNQPLAREVSAILPPEQRRRFSFISYCVNWKAMLQMEIFHLVGTADTPEARSGLQYIQQETGTEVSYLIAGQKPVLPPVPQEAGADYLQRLYPMLLKAGRLELPAESGRWFSASEFAAACPKLGAVGRQALGLMLRASASKKSIYYPLSQEKQALMAALS